MIDNKLSPRGRRRRSLMGASAVAAAVVLALSACSGGSGGSGDSGSVSGQTLTYWATLQGTGADQTQQTLTAEFKKFTAQTGIKVKLEVIPWSTLQTRILNAVTSNDGADVMEIGNTWAPSLAASGGFLEFTPKVLDQIGGQSKFVQTSFAESGLPGKTPMSVPVYATSYSLAYNKADFAAAGISSPPTTWDQLIADGKKLMTNGRYGITLDGSDATDASHWAFILGEQAGSPLYNGSGKPDFANQKLANALTTYIGLFGKNGIANPSDAQSGTQPLADFAKNRAAMTIGQGVATSLVQLGMDPAQFGIAQVPVFSPLPAGGKPIQSHVAGINLAVRASTSHEKAALDLVKFMTSQQEQVTINHIYGTLPVITSAYNDPQFQDASTKVYQDILENHSAPMPRYPSESQMESQLGGALTGLIAKTASTGNPPSTGAIVSALNDAQKKLIASTGGA